MKIKIVAALILIAILYSGCDTDKKIEVISIDDPEYLSYEDVLSKTPVIVKGDSNFIKNIKERMVTTPGKRNQFTTRVFIDETGRIAKIALLYGISKEFNDFALDEIKKIKFEPAEKDGKKVKSHITLFMISDKNGFIMSPELTQYYGQGIQLIPGNAYFVAVEKMPEPAGGIKAIQERVKYPEDAKKKGIEGKVYVLTFINERGTVDTTQIIKGVDPSLNEAAQKAIRETKFYPGMQRGKPVKTQVSIPISFQLD